MLISGRPQLLVVQQYIIMVVNNVGTSLC